MRVLVTGATGALGPAMLEALFLAGWEVRALVRRPDAVLPAAVERSVGDLSDRVALAAAVRDTDAVVHLAALLHITDPPPAMRAQYHEVNVAGTRHLAAAAAEAGVRRLVVASTAALYGPTMVPADEATPPHPDSLYSESKLAAESAALAVHRAGTLDVSVLRLSAVYGPGIKGNYWRLLRALAVGRFVPLGSGLSRRSLVYESDAAAAFVQALRHPAAAGRVYNVSDGSPHQLREIVRSMCDALGRREPSLRIPVAPALVGARLIESATRALGRTPPVTTAAIHKYLESSVIDSSRIARELGFAPQVNLAAGWRATVETLRAAGRLPKVA